MKPITTILTLLALALTASASVTQKDFSGVGNIFVLQSDDWRIASPTADRIGCLNKYGKLIVAKPKTACGNFTRSGVFPYALSTEKGNCTFNDLSQERNTDSKYGRGDYAWNCNATYQSDIYDELYTVDGFPYVFLCFGDAACYYDAKKAPKRNEKLSLWQFHWGSEQMGITPGHVQLLLLWNKTGELPKKGKVTKIPSPRVNLTNGLQTPLSVERTRLG